jgi:hypothetical protein
MKRGLLAKWIHTVYGIRDCHTLLTKEAVALGPYALNARRFGRQEGRTVAKPEEKPAMSSTASEPEPGIRTSAPTPPFKQSPLTTRFLVKYQLRDTGKEEK